VSRLVSELFGGGDRMAGRLYLICEHNEALS
jgi:hypothetical protein